MKKLIVSLLLIVISFTASSQVASRFRNRTMKWFFGMNGAALDFSTGAPVVISGINNAAYFSVSTICDTLGNLVLFSNGMNIYNKNKQLVNLSSDPIAGCGNSVNGTLILPQPGNDSIYYIFTVDCQEWNYTNGFRYTTVNVKANGGQGQIINKDVFVLPNAAESVVATMHSNMTDYWIITSDTSRNLYSYLLTSSGLSPVAHTYHSITSSPGGTIDYTNWLKFSPRGNLIASVDFYTPSFWGVKTKLRLLGFDKQNGTFENELLIKECDVPENLYGCSFSPNGNKLYISDLASDSTGELFPGNILKYNINYPLDADSIKLSEQIFTSPNKVIYSFQNSPNGNMLLVSGIGSSSAIGSPYIQIIDKPNSENLANLTLNAIYLDSACVTNVFNNTIEDWLYDTMYVSNIFESELYQSYQIFPNPVNSALHISSENNYEYFIKIFNITGEIMYQKGKLNHTTDIDLSSYPKGIYILQIITKNKILNKKIILD